MDWIRWISMTMSERILIMVKNKVVLKERDMKALQKLEQMENMVEE